MTITADKARCQKYLREMKQAYPRTCGVCGFGPCTVFRDSPTPGPDANETVLREALQEDLRVFRHSLENLAHQQTGKDPKNDGYNYARVPEWRLRQSIDRIERALAASTPAIEAKS